MSQRSRRVGLAWWNGSEAGAQILAEIGGLAQAEPNNREGRFRIVLAEPVLGDARKQARYAEIPEYQLHQRRHVAMIGDIGSNRALADAARCQADHQKDDGQAHGEKPGAERDDDGHLETSCEHPPEFGFHQDGREVETAHRGAQEAASPACVADAEGLAVESPPGTCSVGVISIWPILTAAGAVIAKAIASAMS